MKDEINEILNEFFVGNYTQDQSLEAILIVIKKYQAKELGASGGNATVEKYGKDHFSKIAKGWPKGRKRKPACCGANSLFPGDVHDIDCPSPIKKVS